MVKESGRRLVVKILPNLDSVGMGGALGSDSDPFWPVGFSSSKEPESVLT